MKSWLKCILLLLFMTANAQDNNKLLEAFSREVYESVRNADTLKVAPLIPTKEIAHAFVNQTEATATDKAEFLRNLDEHMPKFFRDINKDIISAHLDGKENGIDWQQTAYLSMEVISKPPSGNLKIKATKMLVTFSSGNKQYEMVVQTLIVDGKAYLATKPRLAIE